MDLLAPYGAKTQPIINGYCINEKIPCERKGNLWYINAEFVKAAIRWKECTILFDAIEADILDSVEMTEYDRKNCRRNIRNKASRYFKVDGYALLFAGNIIDKADEEVVTQIVIEEIECYKAMQDRVLISQAAEELKVSVYVLKSRIFDGKIKTAKRIKNNWTIERTELESLLKSDEWIGIYDFCITLVAKEKTLFDLESGRHRGLLLIFLRSSQYAGYFRSWDDMEVRGDRRNAVYFPSYISAPLEELIRGYLRRFGAMLKRNQRYLEDHFWESYPNTKLALDRFSENKILSGMTALMELLQATLHTEIMDATNEDIERMVEYALVAPTKIYSKYLVKFLRYVKENYKESKYSISLFFDETQMRTRYMQSDPYPFHQYMLGSYMAFNDEFIEEHGLIEKAINNSTYAWIWLDMCWHYIGAWRTGDIQRIKAIPLLHSKRKVKQMILNNQYEQEAERMSLLLQAEINGKYMNPEKTADSQDTEYLIITIPESLRSVIGTVYSICCLHSDDDVLVSVEKEAKDYIDFFGDSYLKVFGNIPFMNRRANKSFLDALAEITEKDSDNSNKLMGYMVASFARSHSFSGGRLSETTYKYLQTKLDGHSLNEIMMLLWDVGPCSFVPYMLLNVIYGDKFAMLKVEEQAEIMKMVALTPAAAEAISEAVQRIYIKSQAVLDYIFHNYKEPESKKLIAKQILENIIQRKAVGKQLGVICLCSARGVPCVHLNKEICIGCLFSIYERGFFYFMIERIRDMYISLDRAKTEGERRKIQGLLDEIYIPAVYDILHFSKYAYGMDVEDYKLEIMNLMLGGRECVGFGKAVGEGTNNNSTSEGTE